MNLDEAVSRGCVYLCVTGSNAYGTATAGSDLDLRGVFLRSVSDAVTPFDAPEQIEGPGDTVIYELSKYARLLTDQNPNILDLLWAPEDCVRIETPVWQVLKSRRTDFLTKRVRHTFGTYAAGELRRMKGHQKWINNPKPETPPVISDFASFVQDLTPDRRYLPNLPRSKDLLGVSIGNDLFLLYECKDAGGWVARDGSIKLRERRDVAALIDGTSPVVLGKINRDLYRSAKLEWDNYWTWKRNRNEKRAETEALMGYDTKNASHLIRLLRMAKEILTEGEVRVRREDAAELLAIRRGEYSYEQILGMATDMEAEIAAAAESCQLPDMADLSLAACCVAEMYDIFWRRRQFAVPSSFPAGHAPSLMKRVIVADVEGTGRRPQDRGAACEIAGVEIYGGMLTGRSFQSYVNPRDIVSSYASNIHGLTQEFLADKPLFPGVFQRFMDFVGDDPLVLFDANGDRNLLNHDLKVYGMEQLPRSRFLCAQRIARQIMPGAQLSLDKLCDILEVNRSARSAGHGALVDSMLAAECLIKLSSMNGYSDISSASPSAPKAEIMAEKSALSCERVSVDAHARTVTFHLRNGASKTAALPDYPEDTHAYKVSGRYLLITQISSLGNRPDNPCGPAKLYTSNGEIREVYRHLAPDTEETAPLAP